MTRRPLIAGNWKMNGLAADLGWSQALDAELGGEAPACDILLCPPATLLGAFADKPRRFALGGQDCAPVQSGAFTGDIAPAMLADLGCTHVIVGHSERRTGTDKGGHSEDDALVRRKAEAALEAGLVPIICVGETKAERDAGRAEAVVIAQLEGSAPPVPGGAVVIAYEPVWAIGTGLTASADDAQTMHAVIRNSWPGTAPEAVRILYGGSVKPGNAAELLARPDIDGALVGGASLDAGQFAAIIAAVR